MTLDNGTTLGEFRIVGGIGGSAFSEVYKAVRIDDPTAFVALKVHLPNEKTTPRDFCREIENARIVHRIIPDGSPYFTADEVTFDKDFGEVAVVHSIAVTFAALVRRELPEPYARPCARGYVPFPERRYQTFEELRDAIVRAPARDRRRIWLGAGVWKTRIVAGLTVGGIVKVAIAFGLISSGSFLYRHWRICRLRERTLQLRAEQAAEECLRALKNR